MRKIIWSALVVISLGASTLLTSSKFPEENGYKVGDFASDFELKNVDGNKVSMGAIKYSSAKGFIIVFTCNHCPFAKKYEQRILDLDKKFASQGFPVIAINPNDPSREPEDSFENMVKVAKEKNYTFPYLVDETQRLTYTYGAQRTPTVYIVKKTEGKLQVAYIGAIDDNVQDPKAVKEKYVEKAIEEIKSGKMVTTSSTKAVGCLIKWQQ